MTNPLRWSADEFGTPDRALYFRGLCAGVVRHSPNYPIKTGETWAAWIQNDPVEPGLVGWYHTEAEAKAALHEEVRRAISE